jgi:hypothetical protein
VTAPAAARRLRVTPRVAAATLAGTIVVLLGLLFLGAVMAGGLALSKVTAASGLLFIILVTAVVGVVVVRHQPRNPIGWLLAGEAVFMLLSIDAGGWARFVYQHSHPGVPVLGPALLVLSQLFNLSLTGFPLIILLFPDGRLPSPRWRWVLLAYLAIGAAAALSTVIASAGIAIQPHVHFQGNGNLAQLGQGSTAWLAPVLAVFIITVGVFWLAAIGRQALGWRGSTGERRQQLKWLASGAAVCGVFGIWAIATNSAIWEVLILGFAALPLGIGIGILKYRLYEIDRIISRTLAYAIITGLLVGVYAGLVLLATHVLGFTGPVSVAASTLAAAALFAPLRGRVQRIVDRRFNRARYDADQTITAFAACLQGSVDLDTVRANLTSAVDAALEPEHVSLWIAGGGP